MSFGIPNSFCAEHKITLVVPQDVVLGQLLFLLFMNDLEPNLLSKDKKFLHFFIGFLKKYTIILYADDTPVTNEARSFEELQELWMILVRSFVQ